DRLTRGRAVPPPRSQTDHGGWRTPDRPPRGCRRDGTDQEFGVSLEHEDGDTGGGRARCWEISAYTSTARHATFLRGGDQLNRLWRDGVSPVSSGSQARQVKTAVVGWATAESPAAGCGADHDRMTSLLSRSSVIGEPLAALDQGLGQ